MQTKGKWIWENNAAKADEHAEFFAFFSYKKEYGNTVLRISADSDYGVYINGNLVNFGQYPDYPHYKVYDELDITPYLSEGKNAIAVEVWYYGANSQVYILGKAGLFFEIIAGEKTLLCSDSAVSSRLSKTYANHREKLITRQLGFSYAYDARMEDEWKTKGGRDFTPSVERTDEVPQILRPIKLLITGKPIQGKLIKRTKKSLLFDFGRELVGVFRLRFSAEKEEKIVLAYGEHIVDGCVRQHIGGRDFSVEYTAKKGKNDYFGYFRRLGLRYMEIFSERELCDLTIEVLSRNYPLQQTDFKTKDESLQPIYDVCKDTLELCMHDHYEDCPWREQALYAMDSRNQMLCGYYAFKEYNFARSCLKLISMDRRADGMLSICYPSGVDLTIPSFGLHYFTQVREYGDYSGDWAFVEEIYPKLQSVMQAFVSHQEGADNLLPTFVGGNYWNFYEWADGLEGTLGQAEEIKRDLVLNCLYSVALRNMAYISDKLGKKNDFLNRAERLNDLIVSVFFDEKKQAFSMYQGVESYSELGNALAVLCGAAKGEIAENICEKLAGNNAWTKITLSMKCFKYDALLRVNKEKYRAHILEDIKTVYDKMLAWGATSVWETELGESDFDNAGSLCHGWSALPVYYFHILKA